MPKMKANYSWLLKTDVDRLDAWNAADALTNIQSMNTVLGTTWSSYSAKSALDNAPSGVRPAPVLQQTAYVGSPGSRHDSRALLRRHPLVDSDRGQAGRGSAPSWQGSRRAPVAVGFRSGRSNDCGAVHSVSASDRRRQHCSIGPDTGLLGPYRRSQTERKDYGRGLSAQRPRRRPKLCGIDDTGSPGIAHGGNAATSICSPVLPDRPPSSGFT